jgi:hypothetical protein
VSWSWVACCSLCVVVVCHSSSCIVRYGGASSVVVRWVMGRGGASFVVRRQWFPWLFAVRRVHRLPMSFRTVTWRQASPLGRGDVAARRQPPMGGRRWWRHISWVMLMEVDWGAYFQI